MKFIQVPNAILNADKITYVTLLEKATIIKIQMVENDHLIIDNNGYSMEEDYKDILQQLTNK